MLLTGCIAWTLPLSADKTLVYLSYSCKPGTENLYLKQHGLTCSSLNELTYLVYALLVVGFATMVAGAFLYRRSLRGNQNLPRS